MFCTAVGFLRESLTLWPQPTTVKAYLAFWQHPWANNILGSLLFIKSNVIREQNFHWNGSVGAGSLVPVSAFHVLFWYFYPLPFQMRNFLFVSCTVLRVCCFFLWITQNHWAAELWSWFMLFSELFLSKSDIFPAWAPVEKLDINP